MLLTVDHEVFGNGSGDVRRDVTEPAERMARICERFAVPLTVLFEAGEYLAFEREREALVAALGYDLAEELWTQAVDLVKRGQARPPTADPSFRISPRWGQVGRPGGPALPISDHRPPLLPLVFCLLSGRAAISYLLRPSLLSPISQ